MTIETKRQIVELYESGKVNAQIANAASVEELVAVFNENGVAVSAEEVNELLASAKSEELDENTLDTVAGGGVWGHIGSFLWGLLQGLFG